MSEIKITKDSLENAILRDGQFVSGYVTGIGYISADGYGAHAEGFVHNGSINASGYGAHAEGFAHTNSIIATGYGTHAEGRNTQATIYCAHAEGHYTIAEREGAHAEGGWTAASGSRSHAEGHYAQALNCNAHAEGCSTYALGQTSHAEGNNTTASGGSSHAEGYYTESSGAYSHAEGYYTNTGFIEFRDTNKNPSGGTYKKFFILGDQSGIFSSNDIIKIKNGNEFSGELLIDKVVIDYTPAGQITSITTINGSNTDIEQSSLVYKKQIVGGQYAHAEGFGTQALANYSHSAGIGTIANQEAMTAIGKYNVSTNTENTLFVIGNGTGTSDSSRSNAFVVKNDGDILINPFNSSFLISLYDLICRVSPHLIYTSNDNEIVHPNDGTALPRIISNTYNNGYGIMAFDTSCSSIGDRAFYQCNGLTSVTIPNSVTRIGSGAFWDCYDLTYVTIPNSVTNIGGAAFWNCTNLVSVTIPNSVTSIGSQAFDGCSHLTSIDVDSDNQNYCSVDGDLFNKDKTTLIQYPGGKQGSYTIPNSVTSIGSYAFGGCTGLTSVTIGNSVTIIGKYAFIDCTGLTSVTIPNSVESIGEWAFYNCSNLAFIVCSRTTPPNIQSNTFDNTNNCPIQVPESLVKKYKDEWSTYADRIQEISE